LNVQRPDREKGDVRGNGLVPVGKPIFVSPSGIGWSSLCGGGRDGGKGKREAMGPGDGTVSSKKVFGTSVDYREKKKCCVGEGGGKKRTKPWGGSHVIKEGEEKSCWELFVRISLGAREGKEKGSSNRQ